MKKITIFANSNPKFVILVALTMAISNILPTATSNAPNFHYLALFICHLFGHGPFRTLHILHNPNLFDHRLLVEIDSLCSDPIPLYLTDISQPALSPWSEQDNVDNVLQIIFFDFENLATEIERSGDKLQLYRIFVFQSIGILASMDQKLLFETKKRIYDTRTLVSHYNDSSVSIYIENNSNDQSNGNVKLKQEPIFIFNQETSVDGMNLFDKTFGEYERMESIDIFRINSYTSPDELKSYPHLYDAFINYCHFNLKRSHVNIIWYRVFNIPPSKIFHRTKVESQRAYYKEWSFNNYKLIDIATR